MRLAMLKALKFVGYFVYRREICKLHASNAKPTNYGVTLAPQ